MIPEKWKVVDEKQLDGGRVMAKVLVGTNNKENVYEYMYKDVLEGIVKGSYDYNVFTKTAPAVCVYYQDRLIPHNAGIEKIKCDVKDKLGMIPVKLFMRSLNNHKATGDEYAIAHILGRQYNVELIRLCIREMFKEMKSC